VSFDDDLLSAALTRLETAMVPGYNVRLVRGTELHRRNRSIWVPAACWPSPTRPPERYENAGGAPSVYAIELPFDTLSDVPSRPNCSTRHATGPRCDTPQRNVILPSRLLTFAS
jgi:hypothetical protein